MPFISLVAASEIAYPWRGHGIFHVALRTAMMRPGPTGGMQGKIEAGVEEKDDFDETSDFCDFGYVLANSAGSSPAPTSDRRRDGSD
jgi:hypothetical protein